MMLPSYVGRFKVRNEIATGGFAVVLRAWDEELECFVALKILRRWLTENEEIQLRFLDEARLLRRIRSPNVITVHDVGRLNDGRPYFVMDFADRGTLAPRLKRRSGYLELDPQSIMALVDAVADGVSAIHEAGVVHRDIKPANILFQLARRGTVASDTSEAESPLPSMGIVGADERILISDLGIAKDLLKRASSATVVGGTPLYQSPEQGDPTAEITPAADVYAATAMLLHALTGEPPPAVSGVRDRLAGLPDAWRGVIGRGMAIEPEARFSSMESWRAAAHAMLANEAAEAQDGLPTEVVSQETACPYK
ncbi:MAG: serine/threonine-protein kinase, partial [Desulfobacterales bacterium]